MKRILSFFLVLCMVLSLIPAVFAETGGTTPTETKVVTTAPATTEIDKYGDVRLSITSGDFLAAGFAYADLVTVEFLNQTLTLPVIPEYRYVGAREAGLVVWADETKPVELEVFNGSFAANYGLATKTTAEDKSYVWNANEGVTFPVEVTITLAVKDGYRDQYEIFDLKRTNERNDYLDLTDEQFANFRAVATTGMGKNILYRSSSPVNPEIGRNTYADKAAQAHGVKTFINLADNQAKAEAYEDYADTYYSKQNVDFLGLGVDFLSETNRTGLAEGLRYLATHEGPYLVHCNEGQDRAGFVSALLECLMGATLDEVKADYTTTYQNYYGVKSGTKQYTTISNNIVKNLKTVFGVEELTDATLAAQAEAYIKGLGLTDEEVAKLRANLSADSEYKTFEVFETTDVHGYLLDTSSGDESTFQYRLAYIANVVNNAKTANDGVLLFDSGDIYQGTPVSNLTYGNALRAAFDVMDYDAVSLGNHEFDWDVAKYAATDGTMAAYEIGEYKGDSDIPVLAYNLYDTGTTNRSSIVKDYTIVEKEGVKTAVIGYIPDYSMDIMAAKIAPYDIDEDYTKLNAKIDEVIEKEDPDIVMVLAHASPKGVAEAVDASKVDLVMGGHSHAVSYGKTEKGVTYIQGNCQAQGYATARILYNTKTGTVEVQNPTYVKNPDKTALYDTEKNAAHLDATVMAVSHAAWDAVKDEMEEVLGTVDQSITRRKNIGNSTSTIAGNWLTGLMLDATKDLDTVIAFTNSGGIRCDLMMADGATTRDITVGDIYTITPFGNRLLTFDATGAEIAATVNNAFKNANYGDQFSGMVVTYVSTPGTPSEDGRPARDTKTVTSITLDDGTVVDINDNTKTYRIVINEYCATLPGSVFENKTPVQNINEAPIDNLSAIESLRKIGEENDGKIPLDLTERCKPEEKTIENPFTDVKEGAWYYDYVLDMADQGIVKGMTDTTFEPESNLTRAQAAMLLYRLAGEPETEGTSDFTDVPKEAWYAEAIAWAQKNEIVNGMTATTFEPDSEVTRAQFVVMLYRFAGKPENMAATTFTDVTEEWYIDAVSWAETSMIVNGMTATTFEPNGHCTRAQAAKILSVYLKTAK